MRLTTLLLASVATFAAVCATGCAPSDAADTPMDTTESALGSVVDVPNPSGAYVAKITANGTGCPAGSWDANISDDGQAFTVTFNSYETMVEPGRSFSIKDCTLGLDLKTPQGASFAVTSFYYQGYGMLDSEGMTAKQTAKYYFMGNPVAAEEHAREFSGPWEESYLFADEVPVPSLVWSPCGTTRRLNAQTRLVMKNNASRSGSGYFNTSSADGEFQMVLHLAWRTC